MDNEIQRIPKQPTLAKTARIMCFWRPRAKSAGQCPRAFLADADASAANKTSTFMSNPRNVAACKAVSPVRRWCKSRRMSGNALISTLSVSSARFAANINGKWPSRPHRSGFTSPRAASATMDCTSPACAAQQSRLHACAPRRALMSPLKFMMPKGVRNCIAVVIFISQKQRYHARVLI